MEEEEPRVKSWRIGNDGRIHRRRRKVFPNGDVYNCEFVDNKPDGQGTLVTAKGMTYEGAFAGGLFHGSGIITWETLIDGKMVIVERFSGHFKNGKKNGHGVLYKHGDRWEGNFVDDVLNGKGSLWKTNGERQKGTWRNGKLHCEDGFIVFENGDTYEGPVHLGLLHGDVGHYKYAGNNGFYTGQHQRSTKEGIGTRHFCDGSTFRGDVRNGRMSGHGTMTYENDLDNKNRYVGDWKDGLFHGYGELYFDDSSDIEYYKGDFYQGLFHRHGRLRYRDGGYYEGEFNAVGVEGKTLQARFSMFGQRHGKGKRRWASGNTFEGEWRNDTMMEGRYFDVTNQSNYVGTFKHDKKSGSGRETWRSPNGNKFQDPCLGWKHAAGGVLKYSGGFKDGFSSGKGIFQAPDGRKYDGEWKLGKPHGFGTMVFLRKFEFGDPSRMHIGKYESLYRPAKYAGCWKEGKKHGTGNLIFADGSMKEVTYVEGVMIKDS